MTAFDKAFEDVSLLAKKFETGVTHYLSPGYQEAEARKDFIDNKCNSIDRQIDKLVYELYGLTEDEIKIVEGTA